MHYDERIRCSKKNKLSEKITLGRLQSGACAQRSWSSIIEMARKIAVYRAQSVSHITAYINSPKNKMLNQMNTIGSFLYYSIKG